jgi:hypothetical protein
MPDQPPQSNGADTKPTAPSMPAQIRANLARAVSSSVDRMRSSKLTKWLFEQENAVYVSIINPTPAALDSGPPGVDEYRGLQAIVELKRPQGEYEWHLFWRTAHAADQNEFRFLQTLGSGVVERCEVRNIQVQKEKWWKRVLPWSVVATGAFASIAAIITNWQTIQDYREEKAHKPEMTLETRETINVVFHSKEPKVITFRGDPFFRARLDILSMKIQGDPKYPAALSVQSREINDIPGSHLSVDVSQELKVPLSFEDLPPGRYIVHLSGKVSTKWSSAELELPKDGIPLDVRDIIAVHKTAVTPWPPSETEAKSDQALVDFTLLFGDVHDKNSNVKIVLSGNWTSWSMDDPPPQTQVEPQSLNNSQKPKGIVFILQNAPSGKFGSLPLRIRVSAIQPLSGEEWKKEVPEPTAELTN